MSKLRRIAVLAYRLSVVVWIRGEVNQKAELFFKDELQNLVTAIRRNCPAFAVSRLADANALPSFVPARENEDTTPVKVTSRLLVSRCHLFASSSILILLTHRCGLFAKSCSQTRTTRQPACRRVSFTTPSRVLFAVSFFFQNARLFAGMFECLGQACQKQPSTKTAMQGIAKTKSGLPNTG